MGGSLPGMKRLAFGTGRGPASTHFVPGELPEVTAVTAVLGSGRCSPAVRAHHGAGAAGWRRVSVSGACHGSPWVKGSHAVVPAFRPLPRGHVQVTGARSPGHVLGRGLAQGWALSCSTQEGTRGAGGWPWEADLPSSTGAEGKGHTAGGPGGAMLERSREGPRAEQGADLRPLLEARCSRSAASGGQGRGGAGEEQVGAFQP